MADAPRPPHRSCCSQLRLFYEKFVFRGIIGAELPTYFQRISKLAGLLNALSIVQDNLLVMVLD